MADVNRGNRPLSPHLQIYRPQMTSVSSILVRITGNGLVVPAVLVVWWLFAAATSNAHFTLVNDALSSWPGRVVMLGALWAAWYHLLGGVRHLIWDMGYGLDVPTSERMGLSMFILSTAFTALSAALI